MTDPIVSYANIMRAQIKRLDAIAQNTSNVNSTGYLSQSTALSGDHFLALIQNNGQVSPSNYLKAFDVANGSLHYTGKDLDIGILGNAWFVVSNGENVAYTKSGSFIVSADGLLRIRSGEAVLNQSGSEIVISGPVDIGADGKMYIDGKQTDELKLVVLENPSDISSLGNSLYQYKNNVRDANDFRLVQGALVKSNVDTGSDMVKMMEITRSVETLQRAISAYDEMLKAGINEIGK